MSVRESHDTPPRGGRAHIVHIGAGSFFRAHQAWYLSRLIDAGDETWSIIAGNIRDDAAGLLHDLAAQHGVYTLETVNPDGKRGYERIRSISRVLPFASDCAELIAAGADPSARIIAFTVTEAGYCLNAQLGLNVQDTDLATDLAGGRTTIYGVLSAMLAERLDRNAEPVTIMNCDNLRHNGARFRKNFIEFLRMSGKSRLAAWVDGHASFPNSMVDRITPRPSAELADRVRSATGFADKVPVMSESFAQWVIEDQFCAGRPAWERVGAELVDSVLPYEEAKIRILNASHSCFAWYGTLRGLEFIHEGVADPIILEAARDFLTVDVIPALGPSPLNLHDYRDLILKRFSSVDIKDTNQRVASDSFAKTPGFIVPTMRELAAHGMEFEATAFMLGIFYEFLARYYRNELPWEYRDAAMDVKAVQAIFQSDDPPAAYCANVSIFGDLAGQPHIEAAIKRNLGKLEL